MGGWYTVGILVGLGAALGVAAAVLIGLHLDHRRLGCATDSRDRERVRVGLLELVGGAVHAELEELLERAIALEVGTLSEAVTVKAEAALVQTTNAARSSLSVPFANRWIGPRTNCSGCASDRFTSSSTYSG